MIKKISVFALLLSLLLAVPVPAVAPVPVQAANSTETTADDVKYRDIEEFMHGMGYLDFSKLDNALYYVFSYDEYLFVLEQQNCKNANPYTCIAPNVSPNRLFFVFEENIGYKFYAYEYYIPSLASKYDNYTCLVYSSRNFSDADFYFLDVFRTHKYVNYEQNPIYNISNLVFSDVDIYSTDVSDWHFYRDVKNLIFEASANGLYSFPAWCLDAGLNPVSSSNESPSKIPYSYNSYWHIVRKTSSGKWLLTTVGNSVSADNASDYTFVYSEDLGTLKVFNLYSGEDTNGYLLNVRQYEYDTDGWKVRTFETFDARETEDNYIDLGAGSGVDDTRVLAYTSVNIYDEGFNLVTPASTEYVEVTDTPTVTPEPTPGSGSDDSGSSGSGSSGAGRPGSGTRPDIGGEATGGGGLDFIINLFTLIWQKICSIPMAVDGYSISLQQIFVYGALVSIVGGFIIKFIFRR